MLSVVGKNGQGRNKKIEYIRNSEEFDSDGMLADQESTGENDHVSERSQFS